MITMMRMTGSWTMTMRGTTIDRCYKVDPVGQRGGL